jgi:hypothetical protein
LGHVLVGDRIVERLVVEPVGGADAVLLVVAQLRPARVEQVDPLLDALERLHDVALEPDENVHRVIVGAAPGVLGVRLGLGDDPPALGLGLLGETALVDQERGLLLRARDDSLRLFLGLLEDPLALGIDPLRRADLLGNGNAKLVDQPEGGRLVDDDVARQGQPLAVRDDRFESLDEEDDVDRTALRGFDRGRIRRPLPVGRRRCRDYRMAPVGAESVPPAFARLRRRDVLTVTPRCPSSGTADRRTRGTAPATPRR